MKIRLFTPIIAIAALNVAFLAQAHDPKEHMKDAKNPNCAAMQDMDHSQNGYAGSCDAGHDETVRTEHASRGIKKRRGAG